MHQDGVPWNAFGGLRGRSPYATPGEGRRNVYLRSADMAWIRAGVRRLGPDLNVNPSPPVHTLSTHANDIDVHINSPPRIQRCAASAVLEFRRADGTEQTDDSETRASDFRSVSHPAKKDRRSDTQNAANILQHERSHQEKTAS